MKDLSDYVVFQEGKYWIDSDSEPGCHGCGEPNPPFKVGVPFVFTLEGVTRIGVVNCDDGVDEFEMIPFNVV